MTMVFLNGSPIRMVRRLLTVLDHGASMLLGSHCFPIRNEDVPVDHDHPVVHRRLTLVRSTFGAVRAINVVG